MDYDEEVMEKFRAFDQESLAEEEQRIEVLQERGYLKAEEEEEPIKDWKIKAEDPNNRLTVFSKSSSDKIDPQGLNYYYTP